MVHASAKPWDRRSPERLGINTQVDDLFHGRTRVRRSQGSRLTQNDSDAPERQARRRFAVFDCYLCALAGQESFNEA